MAFFRTLFDEDYEKLNQSHMEMHLILMTTIV